jgi:membrane protein
MPKSGTKKIKEYFIYAWHLLRDTAVEFNNDNAIKLSASLSYYTIFALPPLIIIVISLCGIFFGREAVKGEIFGQINSFVGNEAALEIQEIIKNVKLKHDNFFAASIGILTLVLGASGVFAEIQGSINYIWGLKAKPKRGLFKFLKNRLSSFSMIGVFGFLFLVSLIINSVMDLVYDKLTQNFIEEFVVVLYVFNTFTVYSIIVALFCIIFRTLPDGKVELKDTFIASCITAFLFMIGKFAMGCYLSHSRIATTYGAAGSVILILLWVYYSAIILYFGAEFTKVYLRSHKRKIIPNHYAVLIHKEITEKEPRIVNYDD